MKCKVIVDTMQGRHSAHPGLLSDDHIRIAQDLERIASLPLANDHYRDNPTQPITLGPDGDEHLPSASLPYRKVEVLCNTSSGNGRVVGYRVENRVAHISALGGRTLAESIEKWYTDSTTEWASSSYPKLVGERSFSLEQLDKL
ncbi:MAG: hypothetical protein ACOCUH_03205 [Bacteriovoracia bacterium]